MNTSAEAINLLQEALATAHAARRVIDNLVVEHDYQDVASLVVQATAALLEAASMLLQTQDEAALTLLETSDDLLDSVYEIINAETDED